MALTFDGTMWCGSPLWTTITDGLLGVFPYFPTPVVPLNPIAEVCTILLGCIVLIVEPENKGRALDPVVGGADDNEGPAAPIDEEDTVFRLLALRVTTRCVAGEPPITVPVAPTDPVGKVLATLITF